VRQVFLSSSGCFTVVYILKLKWN